LSGLPLYGMVHNFQRNLDLDANKTLHPTHDGFAEWAGELVVMEENKMRYSNIREEDVQNMKGFGYFTPDNLDKGLHAKDFVNENWDATERNKVIQYLKDCYSTGYSYFERLPCHLCNEHDILSSQDMCDGMWTFPEALIHYVEHHNVVPMKSFLGHIRSNNFQVPELPDKFK